MDRERLKEILSIPSFTKYEGDVREYLISFAKDNDIEHHVDPKGNLYMVKGELGEGEFYPCIASHMDTVHEDQQFLVGTGKRLVITEDIHETDGNKETHWMATTSSGLATGIGGDDKCGIAIALELLLRSDKMKVAFFVEEENGCWGSLDCDVDFLSDTGYVIQFDAPTDNWVSEFSMNLIPYSDEFMNDIKPIFNKYGQTNFSDDPFTDVWRLTQALDVSCINVFAGYNNMHTKMEYVVAEQVEKALSMGIEILETFGTKKYQYGYPRSKWNSENLKL